MGTKQSKNPDEAQEVESKNTKVNEDPNRQKEGMISTSAEGGHIVGQDQRTTNENAVCLVTLAGDKEICFGTGTFVTFDGNSSWILTNNHVVSSHEQCARTTFEFGYVSEGTRGRKYSCDPDCLFITNEKLDYSLLSFDFDGCDEKEKDVVKPIDLSSAQNIVPNVGSVISTVQHPRGNPRSFSAQAITSVKKPFIQYKADTDYGSSGCAVFLNAELIGIHHTYLMKEKVNEGSLISSILDDIVEQRKSHSLAMTKRWFDSRKYLKILIFGRTGQGKSALVNALSEKSWPEDRDAAKENEVCVETKDVTEYNVEINGVKITVYDTQGLFDASSQNSKYIEDIRSKSIDLILFCSSFTQTRHIGDDQNVKMVKEVVSLGEKICKQCIVVLTFANGHHPPKWNKMSPAKKRESFVRKLNLLTGQYRQLFASETRQKGFEIKNIPVIPAGYSDEEELPDRNNWLGELWTGIIETLDDAAVPAFWRFTANGDGIQERFSLTEEQIKRTKYAVRESQGALGILGIAGIILENRGVDLLAIPIRFGMDRISRRSGMLERKEMHGRKSEWLDCLKDDTCPKCHQLERHQLERHQLERHRSGDVIRDNFEFIASFSGMITPVCNVCLGPLGCETCLVCNICKPSFFVCKECCERHGLSVDK